MRATAREVVVRWAVVAAETETAMRGAGVHVDPQSAQTAAAVVAASAVAWAEDLAEEMEWPEEMVAKAAEGEAEMGMRSPCRSEVRGTLNWSSAQGTLGGGDGGVCGGLLDGEVLGVGSNGDGLCGGDGGAGGRKGGEGPHP
eukprot:scaffold54796_cov36-Tisochrysis_lutea.AAC.1